jgi:superfamily I DNA and/or RNA helicase
MRAERALLIGDVHQLEPVVRLTAADEHRVRRAAQIGLDDDVLEPYRVFSERPASAQALADRAVVERPALRDHFRCQPAIIAVSDALCDYRLTVHTPPRSLEAKVPWLQTPLLFADVPGQQKRRRGSWENPTEIQVVMRLLESFARVGLSWNTVAVLTPYVAQLETLRQQLRQVGVPLDADRGIGAETPMLFDVGRLATGTVHRFQGGERTVIILSTVVTTQRSLGFLDGRVNLLNVAVSRARDHLIVVGDGGTLRQGRLTRQLIERAAPLQP